MRLSHPNLRVPCRSHKATRRSGNGCPNSLQPVEKAHEPGWSTEELSWPCQQDCTRLSQTLESARFHSRPAALGGALPATKAFKVAAGRVIMKGYQARSQILDSQALERRPILGKQVVQAYGGTRHRRRRWPPLPCGSSWLACGNCLRAQEALAGPFASPCAGCQRSGSSEA